MWLSATNRAYTHGGGGGGGAAPTNLLLALQGQTSINSTPSPPTPPFPNQQSLKWDAVASATQYNIYRDVNGDGNFVLYDSAAVNSYTDVAATLCVSGTAGAGPEYYVANVYRYKVTAVVGGIETLRSTTQSCIYYANGVQDHTGGDFNTGCTSDYASLTGAPQGGHTLSLKNTITSGFGIWLPWAGNNATQWNLPVGAYNYFQLDVKAMQNGSSLQFAALRVGDVSIQAQGGGQLVVQSTTYATLVNSTWVTIKIPLLDLLLDWTSGSGVLQRAFYKTNVQTTSGGAGGIFYVDNVMFVP